MSIRGVGPTPDTFPPQPANNNHSSSGRMTTLAFAGERRLYAGSVAGVWRSNDFGQNWFQLTQPQPPSGTEQADIPGALYAPYIFDLVTSPADPDIVLVSATSSQFADGRDGIYRSGDGGKTWKLVLKSPSRPNGSPFNVVFAPDDPELVYAAGTQLGVMPESGILGISKNGGRTWDTRMAGGSLWHIAVAPLEPDGKRRVYAVGGGVIWYSSDGGQTWKQDAGVATISGSRPLLDSFQKSCDPTAGVGEFGGATALARGNAANILTIEPDNPSKVYFATTGGANGPTYYSGQVPDGTLVNTDCKRLAGEASLWVGDFSGFDTTGEAQWSLLPGPPVYTGATSPSGNRYVVTKPTSTGFLLFFSDNSHVHVSAGTPTGSASWHRLDGMDASEAKRKNKRSNVLFTHVDPHAIAFTPDFEITLKAPSGVDEPYNLNSELDQHMAGKIWMANDGGVYWCDDGGKSEQSWHLPKGLETLDPVNIGGLFGIGNSPALYFGSGDNNDFFTRDGGTHWGDPKSNCGDCDAWFSDIAQANMVIQFLPRKGEGEIGIIKSDGSEYPNAGNASSKTFIPSPKKRNFRDPLLSPYASSDVYLAGYRPLIRTLATEGPLPDGDVLIIEQALDGTANLFRTRAISTITKVTDWHDPNKAEQVGPTLPAGGIVVQASGGHVNPVYYVGDRTGQIWKLSQDKTTWTKIVPNSVVGQIPVKSALQWFVDPYDPDGIYVLDADGIKISTDGGAGWFLDSGMTNAVTGGGKLTISASLLQDMQFSRGERRTRFALGTAGVFCTMNFGISWFPVLNSIAMPGRPESGFFDPLSDQSDRAFYVACEGRSILRIGALPQLPVFEPPPTLDLMFFAALDY